MLSSAVLPVVTIAGVGYVLGRVREVDVDALATITIYVLAPALIFHSLVTTPIDRGTATRLFVGVAAFTLLLAGIATGVGRALGESGGTLDALVLSSSFSNAGNLGIPLSAFAFGALGRSTAVLFLVPQSVLMYTFGVYVASRGSAGSSRDALLSVVRLPLVHAVAAAGLARAADVVPPADSAAMEAIKLTGDAAIPVMLLLLGVQLADSSGGSTVVRTLPATALKLLVAPAVALGLALVLGLSGTVGRVFVLECATPVAITPLMLAVEFGTGGENVSAADYVSTAILVSTLASLATLTGLIALLQSGLLL